MQAFSGVGEVGDCSQASGQNWEDRVPWLTGIDAAPQGWDGAGGGFVQGML